MSRKNYNPGSKSEIIPYETPGFSAGVIKGESPSQIPQNAIADAYDVIVHPGNIEGREGTILYGTVNIPPIDNRTGYTASKAGDTITATTDIFTEDDVSNYFVFPTSTPTHYVIIEYISTTQVKVLTAGDQPLTVGCYLRGKTNLTKWHKILRKFIFIWGQQVYTAKSDLTELVRCRIISRDLPNNSISGYDDFDRNSGIIFNSNGIFKIDFDREIPIVYKLNIPIPNIAIADILEEATSQFNYHYLYSSCKLFEDGNLINRLTPSRIELETGTNIWDDTYRDYADVFLDEPIGRNVYSYGVLTCATLLAPYDNVGGWAAIDLGSFKININGIGIKEIIVDFSNVTNMIEVASAIEYALKDFFSTATCVYGTGEFIITSGRINEGTVTYITAGTASGTTDIATHMGGTSGAGAIISNPYTENPQVVGPLYVPNVPNTNPQEYQWHMTHFPIYRTKDLLGRYKIASDPDQFNSPNDFIWVYDLRICAAFYGHITDSGYFIAEQGAFEEADVGSVLKLEDGSRYEIIEYINILVVRVQYGPDYYGENTNTQAAAIGNGRVMRCTQSGNIVTRTKGSVFTDGDVRKNIKWATGYYSYITEYIDQNNVRVADEQSKTAMGVTLDPIYRYFNDTVSDNTLDARLTRLKLKQRYWEAMPNGNVGKVVPGLMFNAIRGDGQLNYGQIPDTLEYLHGFHDRGYQLTQAIADDIQMMWLFQDLLIIWTSRKTWRWSLANYQFITNPYTRDAILQITGLEVADEDRGCFDWGSIEPIGNGNVQMLTSEPGVVGWRKYNGYQYGPNELVVQEIGKERIPDIQKLQQATSVIYDGRAGLLLFGKE